MESVIKTTEIHDWVNWTKAMRNWQLQLKSKQKFNTFIQLYQNYN